MSIYLSACVIQWFEHTHTHISIYIYMCVHVLIYPSVCLSIYLIMWIDGHMYEHEWGTFGTIVQGMNYIVVNLLMFIHYTFQHLTQNSLSIHMFNSGVHFQSISSADLGCWLLCRSWLNLALYKSSTRCPVDNHESCQPFRYRHILPQLKVFSLAQGLLCLPYHCQQSKQLLTGFVKR